MTGLVKMGKNFIVYSPDDLHEVISECYLLGTDKVLLYACNLPDAFFDISSGLAGEVMQKLSNYQLRTAIVMGEEPKTSTLFSQMTSDANRFGCVRFFRTEEEAESWLKE